MNTNHIDSIKGELSGLISDTIRGNEQTKSPDHRINLQTIINLFNTIIKGSLNETNLVIAKNDESRKFVSFDNIDAQNRDGENPILFVQIFLENSAKRLNILADPYILVEGDPLLGEIQLYQSCPDGKSNPQKVKLSEEKAEEKLFQFFLELIKSFLVTHFKSSTITYV